MSFPLTPPPTSDIGAWTNPRTLNRWLDVNPIGKLTRAETFITLPAFSVDVVWNGYSDIIVAFNFEGSNNFSLKTDYKVPSPLPNYLLCIAWKDDNENMYRYKLWEGVGEVLLFDVPMYTGQLIMKNFRLEVWSTTP